MAQLARRGNRGLRRDPREDAEEARAEAARLRMQVAELEDYKAGLAQQLHTRSEEAEYNLMQVEMGKLLVRRTQLQAVHLEREKEELQRSLHEAQAKLLDVERTYGGLANGLVPRASRGELRPRALSSQGSSRAAQRGQHATQSPPWSGTADTLPPFAAAADSEEGAAVGYADSEPLGPQQSALSAIRSELSVSDSRMPPSERSAFAVYVGLSRREERELRQSQLGRSALTDICLQATYSAFVAVLLGFRFTQAEVENR
jgi:hypothetical protein